MPHILTHYHESELFSAKGASNGNFYDVFGVVICDFDGVISRGDYRDHLIAGVGNRQ